MIKNILSLGIVFAVSIVAALVTQSIPSGLLVLAFAWVIHLGGRIYRIYGELPVPWNFTIRLFDSYPDHIDRGDRCLPVVFTRAAGQTHEDAYLHRFAERIVGKIRDATNEANVVAFVRGQIEGLYRSARKRYPQVLADDIDTLAAEGAVGAFLGMSAFAAFVASDALASEPAPVSPASFAGIVSSVLAIVVGFVGKTELRRELNRRREGDLGQVERIQAELESNLFQRLRIQDRVQHHMDELHLVQTALAHQVQQVAIFADELVATSARTTELIDRVNGELAPALRETINLLQRLSGMKVAVSGSVEITPQTTP